MSADWAGLEQAVSDALAAADARRTSAYFEAIGVAASEGWVAVQPGPDGEPLFALTARGTVAAAEMFEANDVPPPDEAVLTDQRALAQWAFGMMLKLIIEAVLEAHDEMEADA